MTTEAANRAARRTIDALPTETIVPEVESSKVATYLRYQDLPTDVPFGTVAQVRTTTTSPFEPPKHVTHKYKYLPIHGTAYRDSEGNCPGWWLPERLWK